MSDNLPMLPGERPTGVWQPSRAARKPPWFRFDRRTTLSFLPLLIGMLLVVSAVTGYSLTRNPVAIYADGRLYHVRTHARTVARVLASQNIDLEPEVTVSPDPQTRLARDMLVTVQQAREVRIRVDGQTLGILTSSPDAPAILASAGITLRPADTFLVERTQAPTQTEIAQYPSLANLPALPTQLYVIRATTIVINDGQQRFALHTTASTVGEALQTLDAPLFEGDRAAPSFGTRITPDLEIFVQRAHPITLILDGERLATRTLQTSVRGMLAELGLPLTGNDYTIPPADAVLQPGMDVRVVRVAEQIVLEQETIPYETVWRPEPSLELDQRTLLRAGQQGILQREVRVRLEDGQEVSRVVRSEWVAQEPLDEINGYGTRIVIRSLQTEAGTVDYWRHMRVLATSYTAATSGKEPGNSSYGITGVGLPMRRGIIAIDPRVINYFTRMYVPDYGVGMAGDTGGAIRGMRIDLGYDEDNLQLWYQWADVYLLTPVPDPEQMIWVLPQS